MLRNIIGPLFNFKNCVILACFSKIFFLQGERVNKKQQQQKIGPLFNFKKGNNWTTF